MAAALREGKKPTGSEIHYGSLVIHKNLLEKIIPICDLLGTYQIL